MVAPTTLAEQRPLLERTKGLPGLTPAKVLVSVSCSRRSSLFAPSSVHWLCGSLCHYLFPFSPISLSLSLCIPLSL